MIKFSLHCDQGHDFEAWFSSSNDYDTQQKRGFVTCPFCDSAKVEKSLMAPAVSTARGKAKLVPTPSMESGAAPAENLPTPAVPAAPATLAAMPDPTSLLPDGAKEVLAQMREIREQVKANSEDVGEKFPEEARKIHYGETQARGIYGEAKPDEVQSLLEEGVEILPMPPLPEDKN